MPTRKPGLAFIAFFFTVQLVTYATGEVKSPWITLLGCFKDAAAIDIRTLSNSNATNCFKECTTSTFVGIQKNKCICTMTFTSITDVQNADLQTYYRCSRGENGFMSVYAIVSPVPSTINLNADYGHVYVNISSSSSKVFHASQDSQEKHNFICYDNTKQCLFRSGNFDRWESDSAWNECNLVSFYDLDSCLNQSSFETGVFWIGMNRVSSGFISTSSTLSTTASTSTSTSTSSTTPQLTTETPTPLTIATAGKPSDTSLKVETITPTITSFRTVNITSSGNPNITRTAGTAGSIGSTGTPDTTWTKIGAAFIAISCASVIVIIAVLVAFLRKKKENQISPNDQENIIRRDTPTPPADQNSISRQGSTSTSHTGQNHIIKPDSVSMRSNRRGDHSTGDDEIEKSGSEIVLPIPNGLHSVINGSHMQNAEHITPFPVEQSPQPFKNKNIVEETEKIRSHRRDIDVTDLPNTDVDNISKKSKKKRKHRKHRRVKIDDIIQSDTVMGKGEETKRKRSKHHKSDFRGETEVIDVPETALEQSLLGTLENDNIKRKKRRKSKKRKQKHANSTEESDGMNVS